MRRRRICLWAAAIVLGACGGGANTSGRGGDTSSGGRGGAGGNAGNAGGPAAGGAGAGGGAGTVATAGAAGASGPGGTIGTAGASGQGGTVGTAGAPGPGGTIGTAGASGPGGTVGTAGAPGPGGTIGAAGRGGDAAAGSGAAGGGGVAGSGGGGAGGVSCPVVTFAPKVTSVFILVDRSTSGFQTDTTGPYFTLRAALVTALQELALDDQMRLGFTAYYGEGGAAMCDLDLEAVPFALNNAAAIAAKYQALGRPGTPGTIVRAQSSAPLMLPMVKTALEAETGSGERFLLLVSDGGTDFCMDGDETCSSDVVTDQLQHMFAAGIRTRVFGIPQPAANVEKLQAFANAGAGMTVDVLGIALTPATIYDRCFASVAPWRSAWMALGRPERTPIASYGTPTGNAPVYGARSAAGPADEGKMALASMKSCAFTTGAVSIDGARLGEAHVAIQGTEVSRDASHGWSVNAAGSELVLNGAACDNWRRPASRSITLQFPCGVAR